MRRAVKNVVGNYSDIQVKVREATSNDPWGPSGALMSDIADSTYNVVAFDEVIGLLWKRLNDSGKNWRHVYKALVVLEYILRTGSERVTEHCRDNIFTIQTLKDFVFVDKDGKDQGGNVREKSKQLVILIKDDERLSYERSKAIKAKERFDSTSAVGSTDGGSVRRRRNSFDGSTRRAGPVAGGATSTSLQTSPNNAGSQSWQASRRANSSSPATATAGGQDALQRQGTLSSDMARAKPTSQQEEALQLELAMALSREEADLASRARVDEESQLRSVLQSTAPPDPFFSVAATDGAAGRPRPGQANPWAGAAETQVSPSASAQLASSAPVAPAPGWESFEAERVVAPVVDPWGTNKSAAALLSPAARPATSTPELFPSSNGFDSPRVTARGDNVPAGFDPRTIDASMVPMQIAQPQAPDTLEQKFLGDNGTLVNLDSIGGKVPAATTAASANPFGAPAPVLGGTGLRAASNPFQKDKPQTKSLNEMRTREYQAGHGDGGSLLPAPLVPESKADVRRTSSSTIAAGPTIAPTGNPMHPMANPAMSVPMSAPMMVNPMMSMPVQPMVPMQQPGMAPVYAGQNPFAGTVNAGRNPNGFF